MTTYVGQGVKRTEDPSLITGAGRYVDDIRVPGMLHAAVLRSPHAHARIKDIDVSPALSMKGVMAVVTSNDLVGVMDDPRLDPIPPSVRMTEIRQPILARGKVRYVGEPVAVVVAENRYMAQDALDLIRVEYEPLPAVIELADALKDVVILHDDPGTNVVLRIDESSGDVDEAFKVADRVIKRSYSVNRVCPAPMETRGVLALYDKETDVLTVWSATQLPHIHKEELADALKRDYSTVRVIAPDVGGGFGQKARLCSDVAVVCQMAIVLDRPVKWIESRSENMIAIHGRGVDCEVEAAVRSDGTVLGLRYNSVYDIGAYFLSSTTVCPYTIGHGAEGPYRTPAVDVTVRGVATNKPVTGPYRGPGAPTVYFLERTMDAIGTELGLDPADVRRKNFVPSGSFPHKTPLGLTYDSGDYPAGFEQMLEMAGYQDLRREQEQSRAEGRLIGIGLATFVKGSGGAPLHRSSECRLEIDPDGKVRVYTEASPHGQGSETTFGQIVADTLGVRLEEITVLHGDTDMLKTGWGTLASRGMMVSGSTVYLTAKEAREKITQIAAHVFDCQPEDVEMQDGKAYARGAPERQVSFVDIASAAFHEETLPPGLEPGLDFHTYYTLPASGYPFGAQVAVVEVDRDTGEVKLLRCVGVHEGGRIINPKLMEGQIHGGLAQGLGEAMMEGIAYTPEGQPSTGSFMDYGIPLAEDVTEPELGYQEIPSPTGPLGVKGIGELGAAGPPAAIANAVADALSPFGVTHLNTPYTSEKLWRIMHQTSA